jgi:hypothetical protein
MQILNHFRNLTLFNLMFVPLFLSNNAAAQEMMRGKMSCPMCGTMGWGGMVFGGVLMIAMMTAFVALVVYLIRRSRKMPH